MFISRPGQQVADGVNGLLARRRVPLAQFAVWPDPTDAQPICGTGRASRSATAEIAHFHSGRYADLHLSARLIRHFGWYLSRSSALRLLPGSHWATIGLERDWDIDLLMTLVSVALQPLPGRADLDDAFHVVGVGGQPVRAVGPGRVSGGQAGEVPQRCAGLPELGEPSLETLHRPWAPLHAIVDLPWRAVPCRAERPW
ncbi:luciferase family protein [Streptomyces sp. NPDC002134]|uniref:luciferase domain-containing protein n=1 Tax=Streptomyces sp. NPDC002134 TaxID=3364632 RepID=UPI0036C381E0